jgi:hypothetical protein
LFNPISADKANPFSINVFANCAFHFAFLSGVVVRLSPHLLICFMYFNGNSLNAHSIVEKWCVLTLIKIGCSLSECLLFAWRIAIAEVLYRPICTLIKAFPLYARLGRLFGYLTVAAASKAQAIHYMTVMK